MNENENNKNRAQHPTYLFDAIVDNILTSITCPIEEKYGNKLTEFQKMPIPFDPALNKQWSETMTAVINQFDDHLELKEEKRRKLQPIIYKAYTVPKTDDVILPTNNKSDEK